MHNHNEMNKPLPNPINVKFRRLAERTSRILGSPISFVIAVSLIIIWAITGYYLNFSDSWQLIINTGTTIATFLNVILVQNTQNRDARSINLKLDELVLGTKASRNLLLEIEEQSDEEIDALKEEYKLLREKYMRHLEKQHTKKKNGH